MADVKANSKLSEKDCFLRYSSTYHGNHGGFFQSRLSSPYSYSSSYKVTNNSTFTSTQPSLICAARDHLH